MVRKGKVIRKDHIGANVQDTANDMGIGANPETF